VQGEGGIIVPPKDYLKELKAVCHENDVLIIFDEVQTGFGRTGSMFASQTFEVTPDITSLAKAIAGGFPMGAVLASGEVGETFEPGDHAATFGGSPLACAAAKASINVILEENLLEKSRENGAYFKAKLEAIKDKNDVVTDVRGLGLMLGMELNFQCGELVDKMRENGIIINCTAGNVLRFVPPLLISREQINTVTSVLEEVLQDY
jgi:acetylornithine/N-succinyldiaminopimelate aminotransferase